MSCPKFYDFFPSVLNCLSDKKEHSMKEIYEFCAKDMNLTEDDKKETISSGSMPMYVNRASWARTYLSKAGLVEKVGRAIYKLTDRGQEAVKHGTEKVNIDYLSQYESFIEFQRSKSNNSNSCFILPSVVDEQSPLEQIDSALDKLNETLSEDLMSEILKMSPYDFEHLVVKLLMKMGYGTFQQETESVTKKSGDEGIDGIVSADKFGFDSVYIQAKMWKNDSTVGRPEIQKFLGALAGQGATKGLFITTARFSKEAFEYADKQLHQKIVLVDGNQLTKLMIEYNLGVSTVETYSVKKVDYDFFNDDI